MRIDLRSEDISEMKTALHSGESRATSCGNLRPAQMSIAAKQKDLHGRRESRQEGAAHSGVGSTHFSPVSISLGSGDLSQRPIRLRQSHRLHGLVPDVRFEGNLRFS